MRAARLLHILLLLQAAGRLSAPALAERLGVSVRTVQRDLGALEAAGIPLTSARGAGGGWGLVARYRTDLTGMSPAEARALALAGPGPLLADLGLEDTAAAAIAKLLAALPEAACDGADVRRVVHVDLSPWSGQRLASLPDLHRAVVERHPVRFTYAQADDPTTVDPLGLVAKGLVWYLVARRGQPLRTYRVSKITDLELLPATFARPAGFDLETYWKRASRAYVASLPVYPARVRLRGVAARRIHIIPGIHIEAGPATADGWIEMRIDFESEPEACSALMSLGEDVEVLAPDRLRQHIAATAAAIAERNR